MSRTLSAARASLVAAITQDTPGTEAPRLIGVLDALIAWSVAHEGQLAFRADGVSEDTLSFERPGTKIVFWSARVARGVGPRLEILPPTSRSLTPEERTRTMECLNSYSRDVLIEGDRLRIGFGALKNVAARTAVLALMDDLLTGATRPADAIA